ncbi:hypothetical protein VUR80DRAFT_6492 [Thermomyces stellatus]
MPFFIADPDWQGRTRDGIPGQSLIHRPVMEGSDCSSSDDEDNEIDENPDPNRMPQTSHKDPHTAVKEYQQCQIEEVILATKDFDTYASRYPPEAIPKPSSYYANRGIPRQLDIYPKIGRGPLAARDSSTAAVSIKRPTESIEQGEAADFQFHTDRKLRTAHVLCGRELSLSAPNTEASACVTPRSEPYPATNSTISDFVPEWPATTQGFSTLPSCRRQAEKEFPEEREVKQGSVSVARKFFIRVWPERSPQPDARVSTTNHVRRVSGSGGSTAAPTTNGVSNPDFVDITLR